jgi:hypothetical protein
LCFCHDHRRRRIEKTGRRYNLGAALAIRVSIDPSSLDGSAGARTNLEEGGSKKKA